MASSKENLHDVPEASTVDHNDAENEAKPVENTSSTADDSQVHENESTSMNDQPTDDVVPKDGEEISEEIPQIDESLIGHVSNAKCCEDLNTKLFSNHLKSERESGVAKRESSFRRKGSIGSKRQSFRKSRESKKSYERKSQSSGHKDELMGALIDRFQTFVDETTQQVEKIDKKITNLEAPEETESPKVE